LEFHRERHEFGGVLALQDLERDEHVVRHGLRGLPLPARGARPADARLAARADVVGLRQADVGPP
jgi:hypothetical protein